MLVGGNAELMTQESTSFHASQSWSHGVTPLRHEHDERQRLRGLVQQVLRKTGDRIRNPGSQSVSEARSETSTDLKVRHHCIHQLLAERRVGFKRAADRTEGQEGPETHARLSRWDRESGQTVQRIVQLCHLTLWTRRSRRYQGRRSKTV